MLEQLFDQAYMSVQKTGLYMLALLEWNYIFPVNQIWCDFKIHFTQAYDVRLTTTGTKGNQYHGTANAAADEDNMLIIKQSFVAM